MSEFEERESQWLFEMQFKSTRSEANLFHLDMCKWPEFLEYDSLENALGRIHCSDFDQMLEHAKRLTKAQIALKRRVYDEIVKRGF